MMGLFITGIGIVSPLGRGTAENWNHLRQPSNITPHWGQSPQVGYNGFLEGEALAEQAVAEALEEAGLWEEERLTGVDPERIGCVFSASKPLFDGDRVVPPDWINGHVGNRFGLAGERRNVVAACATGPYAAALGASWIEQGLCDVVVAGSVEPAPHPLIEAGFRRMGVLSAAGRTRPFDARRDGFVFGAGAGALILESEPHARRRGGRPLGRLAGWGLGADGRSAIAFNSGGQRIAEVIAQALRRAGLAPEQIQHVNAHGTATRLNDRIETQALQKAFGAHADRLLISATKAATGHLLGASGSVELVLTVLALRHQFAPPTATLEQPDPQCPLNYLPGRGQAARIDHALSLSFGFGGPIGALILEKTS